jgi:glycosyltransferase involved in cell wall biosynthesis
VTARVLHVVEAIEAGVARHVRDVVCRVDAEHIVVLPPERVGGFTDTPAVEAMVEAGAEIHVVPMRRSAADPRNIVAVPRIRGVIRRARPHVVHGHASIGGAAARIAATGSGAARVYTPNGLMPSRAALAVERALGRLTDRFVAVSPTEAEQVSRLRLVPRERIEIIPNGIELDVPGPPTADLRAELGVDPTTPLVGTVGRVAAQKAPEVFVRACGRVSATVPEARFVMVGDGPLADLVSTEVRTNGLQGRFLHLRGLHGAATVMGQLDVFVLASRYEGGPYAPLEAMRAGTPVVLTDVVGNRDTIADGVSGLLVPPDDPGPLAAAVERLLGDPGLRERLGAAGRARFASRYDVGRMADRLEALYRALVST